ncbi:MAG: hypothetical protein H6978_00105 [Gammaproteobacteria bacterium]|nr:hypothetical protein [Gammaproteobacteria bacterium]
MSGASPVDRVSVNGMELITFEGCQKFAIHYAMRDRIKCWEHHPVPRALRGRDRLLCHDYWLGYSANGRDWLLGRSRRNDYTEADEAYGPTDIIAGLRCPPRRNEETILRLLLGLEVTRLETGRIRAGDIARLVAETPFPVYRPLQHCFPQGPEAWHELPVELVVGFRVSEGACIQGGLFYAFRRDSLADAMAVLAGPRQDGVLIHYSLVVREVIPLLTCVADWPLARRGGDPVRRYAASRCVRERVLLTLRQQTRQSSGMFGGPRYFSPTTLWLSVSGFDERAALSHWYHCAQALRRLRTGALAA